MELNWVEILLRVLGRARLCQILTMLEEPGVCTALLHACCVSRHTWQDLRWAQAALANVRAAEADHGCRGVTGVGPELSAGEFAMEAPRLPLAGQQALVSHTWRLMSWKMAISLGLGPKPVK